MAKKKRPIQPDEPLYHADHPRPVTRRDFLRQGFITGTGLVTTGGVFSLFTNPRDAYAALSGDIQTLAADSGCPIQNFTGGSIPFICFDLAGGANFAGSNVLIGQQGGQKDFLSTAGYSKLGLPGDMIPGLSSANFTLLNPSTNNDFINEDLGLAFHADSALLAGILEKATTAATGVNGAAIPARSANDTANNPHNPMYGIARAGAMGEVTTLIGSRSSDSGGNSLAPAMMIDPTIRPTKVDRPSDVTGMVDTGNLTGILNDPQDVVAVMESMARLSHKKVSLNAVTSDAVVQDLMRCGYINAADIADRFAGKDVNPDDRNSDGIIVGDIFSAQEFDSDGEFRKTASVMKMVIDGYAGAGTITMGGYDYHTGDRQAGERRDLRAGRCIGACLEYAARSNNGQGTPLMIYVFSDGSVFSNGTMDNSVDGRGKGVWTGDNSSTAASFFLVYNPNGRPTPLIPEQQIGWFTPDASVNTTSSPAANNVNLLVNTMILNYMVLNGDDGTAFSNLFPNHGLGNLNNLMAFGPLT